MDPLFNGFTKTIRTFHRAEDEIDFQEETEEEEEINDKFLSMETCAANMVSYECKLLNKLNSNLTLMTKPLKSLK